MTYSLRRFFTMSVFLFACYPSYASTTQPTTSPARIIEQIVTDDGLTVARLDNGLTVIVKPMRQAPVICVRAGVRAGGLFEGPYLGCGISHLTEHLVAKGAVHEMDGATDPSAKQTSDRIRQIGGQSNAYTSLDDTGYYIAAAAGQTEACLRLVADWLARPEITEDDFHREHGVVQRELEMGKDNPDRQLWYANTANFFATHPAGVPVIGFATPLAELTYQDVLTYHRRMYVPQNMVFCIVGDVDVSAVLQQTAEAFGGWASGRKPDLALPDVPPIAGVRRVIRPHKALTQTMEMLSFRTIPLIHEDLYALDVLSYVLTQGRASRLVQEIQRQQKLVTSISSSSWTPPWGAGMFTVQFRAEADKADAAEQAVIRQLRQILAESIEDNELTRAKRQKVADYVYSQQTVESVSRTLCSDYLATGDVTFSRSYADRIQAVTAEQVQAVAKKYFDFDAMVITRMTPPEQTTIPATQPTTQAAPQDTATMFTLPNGLRVVLLPSSDTALVSMAFVTRGGVFLEDDQTNGLGSLMTALATKGAAARSAKQIAAFFDAAGGSVAGQCGNNTLYWQGTVLDDSFSEALEIFADILLRPHLSPEELEILRPVQLAKIKRQDEDWFRQLAKYFRGRFFIDSPYRLLSVGSESVVAEVKAEQLKDYHSRWVRAEASVLTVCGRFDAAEARKYIEARFAELPSGQPPREIPPARTVAPAGEQHVLQTENQVAAILVGAPGMKIDELDDRLAIDVLDVIISGWRLPSGWLHEELRGQQLVYVVHAYNFPGLAPGAFQVYAACQPENAPRVVEIIREKLTLAAAYEPSQEEVDLAVHSILTAKLLENQSISAWALSAALDELYGFGYDFRNRLEALYGAVTPADVLRVGRKYLGGGLVVTITTPQVEMFEVPSDDDPCNEGSNP